MSRARNGADVSVYGALFHRPVPDIRGRQNTRHMREKRRSASTLLVVAGLASVAVLCARSAVGAENDRQKATEPSVAVTDTTAAAGSDGDSTRGVPVTDTTTAPAPQDSATSSGAPNRWPGSTVS